MSDFTQRKVWFLLVILALLAALSVALYAVPRNIPQPPPAHMHNGVPTLTGASTTITVEYARTTLERQQGLSGRQTLPADHGMLFFFPLPDKYSFWMPDMHFPLDIVWISADHHIVDISENVSPDSYPQMFTPKSPAQYVLEVNAGSAKLWGWSEGTLLSW